MTDTLSRLGRADRSTTRRSTPPSHRCATCSTCASSTSRRRTRYIHPALEQARAGSAAQTEADHEAHREAIADLRDLAGLVADTRRRRAAPRSPGSTARRHASSVTTSSTWPTRKGRAQRRAVGAYDDAQILEIEHRIVSGIPPQR